MRASLRSSCVPESLLDGDTLDYDSFLKARRSLMASKLRRWFECL